MLSLRTSLLLFLFVPLAGCSHTVYSPPARAVPLESAATLPKGDTGIQLEGATSGALFGPDILSGGARVRHGVTGDLDVAIDANVMRITGQPSAVDVDRNVYAVRGGVKARVAAPLSITAGLGGGYSAAGAFVSPDVGPVVAWENPYVVPFASARVGVSQPIGPQPVDTSTTDDGPGLHVDTPRTTWIAGATIGLRIPIGWPDPEAGRTRGSLLAGFGMTHLADSKDKETFSHFGFGGELVF